MTAQSPCQDVQASSSVSCPPFKVTGQMTADLEKGTRYRATWKIGSGSFGDVYQGIDNLSGEEVAVKVEPRNAQYPQLEYEARILQALAGGVGIPSVHCFVTTPDYKAMVIDLLGPSLENVFNYCNRKFSLKTILLLADQLISRMEYIHANSVIHRDIKPENFLLGFDYRSQLVSVIDFGLAKRYCSSTGRHIRWKENKSLSGTARDDMESLGYLLIYFCRGSLPWQRLKSVNLNQKYDLIKGMKMTTSIESLTKGLPAEFARYLQYTRSLAFSDRPDYEGLKMLFKDLFVRECSPYDCTFDWTTIRHRRLQSAATVSREQARARQISASAQSQSNPADAINSSHSLIVKNKVEQQLSGSETATSLGY